MITRRNFVKGTLGSLAALLGVEAVYAHQIDNPQVFLNLGATGEAYIASFYYGALKSNLDFSEAERNSIKAILLAEYEHRAIFESIGGQSIITEFSVPQTQFDDKVAFAARAAQLENGILAAYLSFVQSFVDTGDSPFAVTMTQIAVSESQHLTLMRQAAGLLPNYFALAPYVELDMNDLITGLDGVMGGSEEVEALTLEFPSDAEIGEIRGELEALGFDSSIQAAIDL